MRWSKVMWAALLWRQPRPTSPLRVARTLASGPAVDPLCCDLFANVHLHLEYELDLEREVEVGDLGFSEF
jgi:hypothetical protein